MPERFYIRRRDPGGAGMTDEEALRRLAFGRILKMASRPEQEDDAAEYERCRAIIIGDQDLPRCRAPNYAKDYHA